LSGERFGLFTLLVSDKRANVLDEPRLIPRGQR
jgi:hypothetical protein